MKAAIVFICLLGFITAPSYAQQPVQDSVQQFKPDSTAPKNRFDLGKMNHPVKPVHSPRTATWRSVVIPGWGQAYNKKYWKIPVIYAGAAGLIFGLSWNHKNYKEFKQIYTYIQDQDSSTIPVYQGNVLDSRYTNWAASNRDYFRKNRDMCAIGLGLIYVLNIVDANVDAHLFEFNVNDDLSLRIEPRIFALNGIGYSGFGATLKIR
ncbi:MAG: hypothetical protein K1X81_05480 [Bacteroidia bacterium]|nr:hypothetical protein [Bacteroidia bacterium]